jgi:hypothetical protein
MRLFDIQLDRRDQWAAILLFFLVVVCGLSQVVFGVCGVYHDDGIYISTAKALAEGDGYRLINLPDSPFQTKYPILYPAVLAVIWKLGPSFPANIMIMQFLNMLIGGASLAICYLYLVRFTYFDRKIAFVAMLICAFSHSFLYFSTVILSEILFLFLTVSMLWYFEIVIEKYSAKPIIVFFTGILITFPFLCRTIGIVYIPVALLIWYTRKYPLRWIVIGILSVLLPYLLYVTIFNNESGNPSVIYYTNYGRWWMSYLIGNASFIAQFNILMIPISLLMIGMEGIFRPVIAQHGYFLILFFLLGIVPFVDIILYNRRGILRYFVIAYLAMILFWPWPPSRFIVPVAPLLFAYLLNAFQYHGVKLLPAVIYRITAISIITIILSTNAALLYQHYDQQQLSRYPRGIITASEQVVKWSSYENIFQWIRAHSSTSDVIACGLDSMVYLYTDRRAFRPFIANPISLFYGGSDPPLGSIEDFMVLIKLYHPKYLVEVPLPEFAENKHFNALVNKVRTEYPDLLIPKYTGDDNHFIIYEIRQELFNNENAGRT